MRAVNVAVTVTLDNGDEIVLNVADPAPGGHNPAFLTAQVHVALDMLERRLHDALEAVHGAQHFRMPRPSDELLAPRERAALRGTAVVPWLTDDAAVAEDREAREQLAPDDGQLVRFPDVYGDNVFRTVDREAGVYEVYIPRGLPKGERYQINTDAAAARWEAHDA